MSSASLPNERKSQPSPSSTATPPSANQSAVRTANSAGSSNTASAPDESAIRARAHFDSAAGSPRCVKCPAIAATTKSQPVLSRVISM